jgi:hypothetical protein
MPSPPAPAENIVLHGRAVDEMKNLAHANSVCVREMRGEQMLLIYPQQQHRPLLNLHIVFL